MVTAMQRGFRGVLTLVCLALVCGSVRAETAAQLLQQLNGFPHAQPVAFSEAQVRDYEVGLGAMRKVGGAWTFKSSKR